MKSTLITALHIRQSYSDGLNERVSVIEVTAHRMPVSEPRLYSRDSPMAEGRSLAMG